MLNFISLTAFVTNVKSYSTATYTWKPVGFPALGRNADKRKAHH